MLVCVVDDVGSVGAPDCDCAVVQSTREVLLIWQREGSRGNVIYVLVGPAVLQNNFLRETLLLFLGEPLGDLLQEMLNVDIVGIVICLSAEDLCDFELLCIGPAVDDPFWDVDEPAFLKLFLLLELHLGVDEVEEGLEGRQLGRRVVVVAVLDQVLGFLDYWVQLDFLLLLRLLWLCGLFLFLFRVLLRLYNLNWRLYFLGHFGKQLLSCQCHPLALKLQLQYLLADLANLSFYSRVGQWIPQSLLELLLLERNGLILIDLAEIYCDFWDPVHLDAAIEGIDNEQSAVIAELAAEGQPVRVVLISSDLHAVREL